jgi:hypothetical protein
LSRSQAAEPRIAELSGPGDQQILVALFDVQMKVKKERQCEMYSILYSLQQFQSEKVDCNVVGASFEWLGRQPSEGRDL